GLVTGNEPVHLPAVNVGRRVPRIVRASPAVVVMVLVRALTSAILRVRQTRGRMPVRISNPIRAWKHTEIRVERPVLLHDHDDMLNLVDPRQRRRRRRGARRRPDTLRHDRPHDTQRHYRHNENDRSPAPQSPTVATSAVAVARPRIPGHDRPHAFIASRHTGTPAVAHTSGRLARTVYFSQRLPSMRKGRPVPSP